jgi:hypothetical protein
MNERSTGSNSFVTSMSFGVLMSTVCAAIALSTLQVTNDDAFITFTYARNLAAGHGFVFNIGERVLGTTAPLWAMLLAGVSVAAKADVSSVARLAAIVCLFITSVLLTRLLTSREELAYVGAFLPTTVFFTRA